MRSRLPLAPLVAAAAMAVVGLSQPRLAGEVHAVKMRDDVYAFPPPKELRAASLGYRAALADMLWAKLLVEYGMHWSEKRAFLDGPKYLDAILELQPDYPLVYKYVDTLLVYRPPSGGDESDARLARKYLERGTRERPNDYQVWLEYGQFIAYLGPSWLASDAERETWRHDGALALVHAVELGADPSNSLNAAATLKRFGDRAAAVQQLERAYALTDDPEMRKQIGAKLAALDAAGERERAERNTRVIEGLWRSEYPFLTRTAYLLTGPLIDPVACAGRDAPASQCSRDWQDRLPSEPGK